MTKHLLICFAFAASVALAQNDPRDPIVALDRLIGCIQTSDYKCAQTQNGIVLVSAMRKLGNVSSPSPQVERYDPASGNAPLLAIAQQMKADYNAADYAKVKAASNSLSLAFANIYNSLYPTPQAKFGQAEQELQGKVGIERFSYLGIAVQKGRQANNVDKVRPLAEELLATAKLHPEWPQGDALHQANIALGWLAMQQRDPAAAKEYLQAAGNVPGSPVLGSFGPNMSLAQDLLKAGEKEAVLLYFAQCKKFWKSGLQRLETWTNEVQSGGMPNFGQSLIH